MKIREAIEIMEKHGRWRKGLDPDMLPPKLITETTNTMINELRQHVCTCAHPIGVSVEGAAYGHKCLSCQKLIR